MTTAVGVLMTEEMMRYILGELEFETIIAPNKEWSTDLRVQKRVFGYRKGVVGLIQSSLSLGLERVQPKEKP
jgi:hypothetical protein